MKIGISAFAWTASISLKHLPLVSRMAQHGFSALEIPMFVPSALPVAALRNEFETNDIVCTVCAILPAGINPISLDAEVRKRSVAHLRECIETSAELGAHLIGGPIFAPIGYLPAHRPTSDEWDWAIEAFQSVTGLLDQYSMTLSIEPVNRSETFFLRTAQEAKRLCEAIAHPLVGVTIDTFHANIEEKSISAAIASLGTTLKHLHLSENDRGLLGRGHVNFPEILQSAKAIGFDGHFLIEGFGFSAEEPDAPGALWAEQHVSPEDIAFKGLAYLKSLAGHESPSRPAS